MSQNVVKIDRRRKYIWITVVINALHSLNLFKLMNFSSNIDRTVKTGRNPLVCSRYLFRKQTSIQ